MIWCSDMFVHVVHYAVAIKIFSRCPPAALRGLIANETCPRAPKHYHCLENLQSEDLLQICIKPERLEEGEYPVFQDSRAKYIFPKTCMSSRYQPRPMFTYERNECWYEKSSCTGEGQIVFSNGSATDDRTCRCDYTKGYAFISTPINKCYCVSSKEDCSCYKKECLNKREVINADYMCSTVKFNETCPDINSIKYPDIPKRKINNTDINTVLFNHRWKDVKLLSAIIIFIIVLLFLLPTIFIIYYEYDERNSIMCMFSYKLSQQNSEESSKPELVPSMEVKNEAGVEIVNLQRKEEHIDDGEHLSAVKVTMGNTKPLPNEQPDKDIYDAVIVCETEDNEEATEFVRHIQELDKEWQLDIKIELSVIIQKGGEISSSEKLFDIARFIFIFCTAKSCSKVLERFKNETLLVKSLLDSDKLFRIIPVSVDGHECIPFEFISLIPINYYSFKQTKEKGIEDKVYIGMLQKLFRTGREKHFLY